MFDGILPRFVEYANVLLNSPTSHRSRKYRGWRASDGNRFFDREQSYTELHGAVRPHLSKAERAVAVAVARESAASERHCCDMTSAGELTTALVRT